LKVIASLEIAQAAEVMERLKQRSIPATITRRLQEGGLELSEIGVAEEFYDRGCEVVETWYAQQEDESRHARRLCCPKCGARDYQRTWDDKIGEVCTCPHCGTVFVPR
jgi:hypothetical protein